MSAPPRVSVVICAFRSRRDHLSAAISSALAQSEPDIEVILSDDSPDDGLRALVDSYRDARLRYRRNPRPLGSAGNHWAAFAQACGTYIAILNHDDWMAPQFVASLADELDRHPSATLAFCDHWIIDSNGRRLDAASDSASAHWGRDRLPRGLHRPFHDLVARQTIPVAMGSLIRRSALPDAWPMNAGPAYDLWLGYLLAREGGGAVYIDRRLSAWRDHAENQTSASSLAWRRGAADCWHAMAQDPRCAAVRDIARRKAALGYSGCASSAHATGRRSEALAFAWHSLRARLTGRGLATLLATLLPYRWVEAARRVRIGQ